MPDLILKVGWNINPLDTVPTSEKKSNDLYLIYPPETVVVGPKGEKGEKGDKGEMQWSTTNW